VEKKQHRFENRCAVAYKKKGVLLFLVADQGILSIFYKEYTISSEMPMPTSTSTFSHEIRIRGEDVKPMQRRTDTASDNGFPFTVSVKKKNDDYSTKTSSSSFRVEIFHDQVTTNDAWYEDRRRKAERRICSTNAEDVHRGRCFQ